MSEEQDVALEANENEEVVEPKTSRSKLTSLEDALKVVDKLRDENSSLRVRNKTEKTAAEVKQAEDAAKWQEHLDSQKTELEKLTERNAALEAALSMEKTSKLQRDIADEFKLDPELAEFVTGSDEDEMRARAKKLSERTASAAGADLRGGDRGAPVVSDKSAGGKFLESLIPRNS